MTGPVIYEVNVEIDPAIDAEYRAWLVVHVREMLALPGVMSARGCDISEPPAADGWAGLCVQYTMHDADALATYLRDHAPRMRASGIDRFGRQFRATRRVLHPHSD